MFKGLSLITLSAAVFVAFAPLTEAVAQNQSRDLGSSLSRLQNNPRYQGRILGTHVVRRQSRQLYEVRILRPDDRVILVYIDPKTGGVVGDSERQRTNSNRGRRQNPASTFGGRGRKR